MSDSIASGAAMSTANGSGLILPPQYDGCAIHPVARDTKRPVMKEWPAKFERYRAGESVVGWDGPIGVNCGESALIVIDTDTYDMKTDEDGHLVWSHGEDSLTTWLGELDITMPDTFTTKTPGGGWHRYLRVPHGTVVKNRGRFVPGVDLKATGGQVVAAGSAVASGTYVVDRDVPIADAPPKLVEALQHVRSAGTNRGGGAGGGGGGKGDAFDRAYLRDATAPVPKGIRHHLAYAYASSMRGRGVDIAEAKTLMEVRWLAFDQPQGEPYSLEDALVQVEWAYAHHDAPDELADEQIAWAAAVGSGVSGQRSVVTERLQPMGTAVLDQPETPPAVWGRDKFIAWSCGQGTMVASHQGLGKSTIAQQLVLHRVEVRNGDFLGMPVTPIESGKKVLYLAMDRPMQIKQSLRRMLCEADRAVLDDRAVLWHGPLPFNLMENPLRFADWVQEICPDVGDVIVDSVKDLAAGVSKDEVGSAVNIAWQELIARNIELLLLHHQRKAEQGGKRVNALDDVYGSTWLTSGLGSVFALDGDPGAQVVTLKHLKPVMMQLDDTEIRHDHLTGTTAPHNANRVDLFDLVRNAGDVGVTAVEAAQAVIGASGTTEVQKIRRELNKLVTKERVEKLPGIRTNQGAEPDRWRIRDEHRWAVQLDE